MDKIRRGFITIIACLGMFLMFIIWLAFTHFFWFLVIAGLAVGVFYYGIRYAEKVDNNHYI